METDSPTTHTKIGFECPGIKKKTVVSHFTTKPSVVIIGMLVNNIDFLS